MIEKSGTIDEQEALEEIPPPFTGLKRGDASRAMQTFFRSSFRTHVSLVSIADRKANILLRLNSFLVSGGLVLFKYILDNSEISFTTMSLFLTTTITSMILAALATRPHKDGVRKENIISSESAPEHMFFYNNYVNMGVNEYENAFNIMMRDAGLIYKNMAMDLYKFAKTISYKYRLLRMSYNVFVIGFITTFISFLVDYLITS